MLAIDNINNIRYILSSWKNSTNIAADIKDASEELDICSAI